MLVLVDGPATPEIYPLSLHDALPISHEPVVLVRQQELVHRQHRALIAARLEDDRANERFADAQSQERVIQFAEGAQGRSEEHTSELQSHSDIVCRLLLEKKNTEQERK